MPGMRVTLDAAMRARDVSRPRAAHDAAAAPSLGELSTPAERATTPRSTTRQAAQKPRRPSTALARRDRVRDAARHDAVPGDVPQDDVPHDDVPHDDVPHDERVTRERMSWPQPEGVPGRHIGGGGAGPEDDPRNPRPAASRDAGPCLPGVPPARREPDPGSQPGSQPDPPADAPHRLPRRRKRHRRGR